MTARTLIALLAFAALAAGACGIFGPPTELRVVNESGVELEVLAAPCSREPTTFAVLADGERHTEEVVPGCWRLEGWTDAGAAGTTVVEVPNGTLRRLAWHEDGAIRNR